ncbi:MAG: DEAD/DEAH box helicase, partial [Synergistaceae bacterium]|nr:DEAD/DEAH box helicase [Synergistaceae bacterium]
QSLRVIHDAQEKGLPRFDLVICDEAHRTAGTIMKDGKESLFRLIHRGDYIHARKRLYMTATPKIFGEGAKSKAKENDAPLYSMDDENIYGPEFFRFSFHDAIEATQLSDYKVIVFTYYFDPNQPAIRKIDDRHSFTMTDTAKIIGIRRALAKELYPADYDAMREDLAPMRSAVVFTNTINASETFRDAFSIVTREADSLFNVKIDCSTQHIDGSDSAGTRANALAMLQDVPEGTCRILSNARCLSEGVDVPALDAIVFLNPKSSEVDIVQSAGRVMRKAPGKKFGYVIIPVAVKPGAKPHEELDKNEEWKTVWRVLKAMRSHDNTFQSAVINELRFNGKSQKVIVVPPIGNDAENFSQQLAIQFTEWEKAITAKIVEKCGDREYWDKWTRDLADIAREIERKIREALTNPDAKRAFESFLNSLRSNISKQVTDDDAIDMLTQHMITEKVFDAFFSGFSKLNPVSLAMNKMISALKPYNVAERLTELQTFYSHIYASAQQAATSEAKYEFMHHLYEDFFKKALPKTAEKLGIVYTPNEIVDFILNSVDWALRELLHFSDGLASHDVKILDPFSGTGKFTARLIRSGLLGNLTGDKYESKLFANEILPLAYYISAVNIESAFAEYNKGRAGYLPFTGMVLADTFTHDNQATRSIAPMFHENGLRSYIESETDFNVIIGNPPYNVGGKIPGYEAIDGRISDTYSDYSEATNKSALYDSYIRALRWASDRLASSGGVVCFVTNASFIDGAAMDGMRYHLAKDFTSIYIFNLRGNANTSGELRSREAGNVFEDGTKCPIAITLFVRDIRRLNEPCGIWYCECGDGMTTKAKLMELKERVSFGEMMKAEMMRRVVPDDICSWINQLSEEYGGFYSLGSKKKNSRHGQRPTIFGDRYSAGVKTGHDAYSCNFSREELCRNMKAFMPDDFREGAVRTWLYSPYVKEYVHFSHDTIQRVYQMYQIFPKRDSENLLICVAGVGNKKFSVLMTDTMPSLSIVEASQCFPLYWYEEVESPLLGLHKKCRDGISDSALRDFRAHYNDDTITKEDMFYYIYGVLSSREYAERFGNDTKKVLARVPYVKDADTFREFSEAGRKLGALHVNYESADEWPIEVCGDASDLRVSKMRIVEDKDTHERFIQYNAGITLRGIPREAWEYRVNGRSALEWIVERYRDDVDKASGLRNDCNAWGEGDYVLRLIRRVVSVSVETVRILGGLPELGV